MVSTDILWADYSLLSKIEIQRRKPQNLKSGFKMVGLRPTYTVVLAPREKIVDSTAFKEESTAADKCNQTEAPKQENEHGSSNRSSLKCSIFFHASWLQYVSPLSERPMLVGLYKWVVGQRQEKKLDGAISLQRPSNSKKLPEKRLEYIHTIM